MKFTEAIRFLKSIDSTRELVSQTMGDLDTTVIDVYLKDALVIDAEMAFFDADKIPGTLEMSIDGVLYVNLFPLEMLQEMVEDYSKCLSGKLVDNEIAQHILDYRIKDK